MNLRATFSALAVGAALAAGTLAGCGSDDDEPAAPADGETTEQTTTQQSQGGY
jgi:hypothetical protein